MTNKETDRQKGEDTFPICVFPKEIRQIVNELATDRLFPTAYIGSAILFAVSVLIGTGSYLWTILGDTFANIFVAIVGDQGTNKSTPIAWAIKPLLEADHRAIEIYKKQYEEWSDQISRYEHTKCDSDRPGPMPMCPRLLCSDTTPEELLHLLAANKMGLGQYQDELTRLFSGFSRYHKESNDDLLLQLFSGKPIAVDRATRTDIISMLHPYYSLIGSIQPKRFIQLMGKNDRFSSGLFSRFFLVTHLDNSALLWNLAEDLPSDVDDRYARIIQIFIDRRNETLADNPVAFKLSEDAAYTIQDWQNTHELRIEEFGRDTDRAVFRKSQIYVLKFALILQIMWDVCEEKENPDHIVSAKTAILATVLADYIYHTAKELGRSLDAQAVTPTEKRVYDALPDTFTTAEGRQVAKDLGLGKTCFHQFLNKIKGVLIDQHSRGVYTKRDPMIKISKL